MAIYATKTVIGFPLMVSIGYSISSKVENDILLVFITRFV